MGDLNCRVGQEIDYIESDDGDRFLNLPFQLDHTNLKDKGVNPCSNMGGMIFG